MREITLYFTFQFGDYRVKAFHQIHECFGPKLAFSVIKDVPEWDIDGRMNNEEIRRDKAQFTELLKIYEKQAFHCAIDQLSKDVKTERSSLDGRMGEFGFKEAL